MQVAAVAYDMLSPTAKARCAALLRLNPSYANWIAGAHESAQDRTAFLRAATWADAIKSDKTFTDKKDDQAASTASQNIGYADKLRHRYWHFIDVPFSPDATPLTVTPAPNAQTQIVAFRAVLSTPGANEDVKSYDLSWLLHLVGDVHQPLHCSTRFDVADPHGDRGGNNVLITGNVSPTICDDPRFCPYGPPHELHAFIDDITGSSYCLAEVDASIAGLPKPTQAQLANLDEASWVAEGAALAQSAVYIAPIGVGDGPFTIDDSYQSSVLALGKRRIALAGARLAALLNDCFAREAAAAARRATPKTSPRD
jgi:hypothetical protein